MVRTFICCMALLLAAGAAHAADTAEPPKGGDKQLSGMSIVGNDDAPKALVIVPWKTSGMGSPLDVSRALDDGRQPVDREVFQRELDYYQIRSESSGAKNPGAN